MSTFLQKDTFKWVPQYGPYLRSGKYINTLRRLLPPVNFYFVFCFFVFCCCCCYCFCCCCCCCCVCMSVCVCDPLNRTGSNFVMVALVLKTFVARLLLLVHFQLCVRVCVCVLLFFLFFSSFLRAQFVVR